MKPFNFGGDMIESVTYQKSTWNKVPEKFEAGTPNIAGAKGLLAAVEYLEVLGIENIGAHERQLVNYALKKLSKIKEVQLYNPGEKNTAGIISFNLNGIHSHDAASILDDYKVCVRAGHHCNMPLMHKLQIEGTLRISFAAYNNEKDVDTLIEGINKAITLFGKK